MEQTKKTGHMRTLLYEGALLLVGIIWGWGFIATRVAVDESLSASFILMGRFLIAAVVFGLAFLRHLRRTLTRNSVYAGIILGALLFCGFITQTIAMEHATPSNVGFLTSTNVVMVPLLWWLFAHKRPSLRVGAACILGLCGIAALSYQWGTAFTFGWGDLLSLICAMFFAAHIALTGLFSVRHDSKVLVFVQFASAAVLSAAFFLIFDRDLSPLSSLPGLAAVGYLGVFSTCLCFFLQTTAQVHVPASSAALLLCTESLFCTIFSVLVGYEPVTVNMLLGGTIITASVVLCEWPADRKKPSGTEKGRKEA